MKPAHFTRSRGLFRCTATPTTLTLRNLTPLPDPETCQNLLIRLHMARSLLRRKSNAQPF